MQRIDQLFPEGHLIRRDFERINFKSNVISLYFVRPLSRHEATLGALLGRVLSFSSEEYPGLQAISDKEDDLYGVVVYFDSNKYRDRLVFEYKMVYPKYRLLPIAHDLTDEAMAFYHSLLAKPMMKNGRFDPVVFRTEKAKLLEEIESLQKDPAAYAYRRCIEEHFRDSDLGLYKYGDVETLRKLTNRQLTAFYHHLFTEAEVYCYRHGDFENSPPARRLKPASREVLPWIDETATIEEERPINQSILVQAYQTDIEHTSPQSQAAMMFSYILGGYSNSVLFREIRENLGYCYYIYTKYDKYRNVMFLNTGYREENHTALIEKINDLVKDIQNGNIDETDFAIAKLEAIQGLKSLHDRQMTLLDYQFIQDLFQKPETIEDRVRQLDELTLDDVAQAAKSFHLTTAYHLKGTKE